MNDWIYVKLDWLNQDKKWNGKQNLISLKVDGIGPIRLVYLREDISTWIKENDVNFESSYEPNYLASIDDEIEFLAIKFTDPRDKLMFIIRFE